VTVVVREGEYPQLEIHGSGPGSGFTTFRPRHGEDVSVAGLELAGARRLRFRGLRVTGRTDLSRGARHLQLIGNDFSPHGLTVRGVSDLLVVGNRIHDLSRDPASVPDDGYGIWATDYNDVPNRRLTIRGNRFKRIPHDAIQMGSVENVLIEHNEIAHVAATCCDDHSDVLQITDGDDITVRSNYMHDSVHGVIVKAFELRNISFEDNVITRMSAGFGLNLYDIDGLSLVANSVWDTAAGVRLRDSDDNPMPMRVSALRRNVFDRFASECGSCAAGFRARGVSGRRAARHVQRHIGRIRRALHHYHARWSPRRAAPR
jgi:nitrous oxidase accessory protein NosD